MSFRNVVPSLLCLSFLLAALAGPGAQAAVRKKTTAVEKRATPPKSVKPAGPAKDEDEDPDSGRPTVGSQPGRGDFGIFGEGEIPLAARGAIVLDGYSGRTLYAKNAEQPQYPASTTKIMTALLVIEAGHLEQEVEIT